MQNLKQKSRSTVVCVPVRSLVKTLTFCCIINTSNLKYEKSNCRNEYDH